MTRRQLVIAGTQRTEHQDIEDACAAYCNVRDERSALSKREAQKKAELLALMQVRKVPKYKFLDDNGEEILIEVEEVETVKVKKTGEAESEIGEGVSSSSSAPGIHPGLIAAAERAQHDNGIEVDSEGDVVVPNTSAKRVKAKSKPNKKPKARA